MSDSDLRLLIRLFNKFIYFYGDIGEPERTELLAVLQLITFVRYDENNLDNFVGCPDD